MVNSLESVNKIQEIQNVVIMDYLSFANYVLKAVNILLSGEDVMYPTLASIIDDSKNQECIKKFISDPQIHVLYIQRSCSKGMKNGWSQPFLQLYVLLNVHIIKC